MERFSSTMHRMNRNKNGLKIISKKVVVNKGKKRATRDEIIEIAKRMKENFLKDGKRGKMQVTLFYDNDNQPFKASKFFSFKDDVELFSYASVYDEAGDDDPETYGKFFIQVYFKPDKNADDDSEDEPEGGCDYGKNDCLYDCLELFVIKNDLAKLGTRAQFKKSLGLNRRDMVPVSKINKIEKLLLKYRIHISGDLHQPSTHIPTGISTDIYLTLVDRHYEVDDMVGRNKLISNVVGVFEYPKWPLIYRDIEDKTEVCFRNPEGVLIKGIWSREKIKELFAFRNRNYFSKDSKYFTGKNYWIGIDYNQVDSKRDGIVARYHDFNKIADLWIRETKYKKYEINIYKSGSPRKTALQLFRQTVNGKIIPETISFKEMKYISKASNGPLMYADKGYRGKGWKYDVVSMYPSVMYEAVFFFPIKAPEYLIMTTEEFNEKLNDNKKSFLFGLYHCKAINVIKQDKHFRLSKRNWYTHLDLNRGKNRGVQFEIIQNNKPNFLYYDPKTKCVSGRQVFKEYIDYVFQFKERGLPMAKTLLNCLWGGCSYQNKAQLKASPDCQPEIRTDTHKFVDMKQKTDDQFLIKMVNKSYPYYEQWARMKPFLLSKAREKILNITYAHKDKIVRLHTDGFIVKEPIEFKCGEKMGELRYEGYCENVYVKNINHVEGEFN